MINVVEHLCLAKTSEKKNRALAREVSEAFLVITVAFANRTPIFSPQTNRIVFLGRKFGVSPFEIWAKSFDQSRTPRPRAPHGRQRVEGLQDDPKGLDPHGPVTTQFVLLGHLGHAPWINQNHMLHVRRMPSCGKWQWPRG